MKITIKGNSELIITQYLSFLNPLLGGRRLKETELKVMSKLIYIDRMYRDLKKEQRDKILFHQETKKRVRKSLLHMSEASYNNVILSLRKKGFIENNSIAISNPFINDGKVEISVNFQISDES